MSYLRKFRRKQLNVHQYGTKGPRRSCGAGCPQWEAGVKAEDARRLAEIRRSIPEQARRLGSVEAVCAEILRDHPDLMALLGELLLRGWVKDRVRRVKEPRPEMPGQLPMFGQFGDQIIPRDQWKPDHYQVYSRRHQEVAARNTAIVRALADEYAERFGRP